MNIFVSSFAVAHRLMAGLCPSKKMSCIGKFRRNVLDKNETIRLLIYWVLGGLLNVTCNLLFVRFEKHLRPSVIFNLNSFFWLLLLEVPMLYLTFILTRREIPRIAEIPRSTKFYVLKPSLEPRRSSYVYTSLVNDIRGHEDGPNCEELVLPPIVHIPQGGFERNELQRKAKGNSGRHSVANIGEGCSGWFDFPPVSWTTPDSLENTCSCSDHMLFELKWEFPEHCGWSKQKALKNKIGILINHVLFHAPT